MNICKLLESLCLAPAPSGYEKESATVLYNALVHYVDEIKIDHMDQLGFIVRRIEANGFIQIDRLGGVPEKILLAQRIAIRNTDGDYIPGVIGTKAHHAASAEEKYKVDDIRSLFVDVGVNSREEVKALGIEISCPAVYEPNFQIMGGPYGQWHSN